MNTRCSSSPFVSLALAALTLSLVLAGCGGSPSGPYLGQQDPGNTPRPFAPGFIRGNVHATAVFSPNGYEVYWSLWSDRGEQTTMYSRQDDGTWTPRAEASFSRDGGAGNPCFSPDGNKLFFTSKRQPGRPDDPAAKENIWQADRLISGWTTPVMLPEAVNALYVHWLLSVADSGNLYFGAGETREAARDIYLARLVDGEYTDVVKLSPEINTEQCEDCPFVARDGSYLIFARVVNAARTNSDLLISFRRADGGWGEPVNLGAPINSADIEISPWVSDDGKYLFFVRNQSGRARVYWVSAGIIEELRRAAGD